VAEKKSTEVPIKEKKPCAPETLDEVDALKDAVSKQQATVSLVQRWNKEHKLNLDEAELARVFTLLKIDKSGAGARDQLDKLGVGFLSDRLVVPLDVGSVVHDTPEETLTALKSLESLQSREVVSQVSCGIFSKWCEQKHSTDVVQEFAPVFAELARDAEQQSWVLYGAQMAWSRAGAPKGVIKPLFVFLNSSGIICPEAFFKWRDAKDNKDFQKPKVLLQVNSWVQELFETYAPKPEEEEGHEAEESEEEEEEFEGYSRGYSKRI